MFVRSGVENDLRLLFSHELVNEIATSEINEQRTQD